MMQRTMQVKDFLLENVDSGLFTPVMSPKMIKDLSSFSKKTK